MAVAVEAIAYTVNRVIYCNATVVLVLLLLVCQYLLQFSNFNVPELRNKKQQKEQQIPLSFKYPVELIQMTIAGGINWAPRGGTASAAEA